LTPSGESLPPPGESFLTGQKDLSNFDLEREQASSSTTGFIELIDSWIHRPSRQPGFIDLLDSLDSSTYSTAWIHRLARQLDSSTYSTAGFVDLLDSLDSTGLLASL
jgi:hypothetical protein